MIEKLAAAIYNDIVSGLVGITSTPTLSMDQLQDDVVDERLQIIKEYSLKNLVPVKDLIMSINCIDVDCKSLDKCPCGIESFSPPIAHFEIPQVVNDLAANSIQFVGSVDRMIQFKVYTTTAWQFHKYLRRGANKPFVYIETTPNENNMYDGWIFNAPMLEKLSVIAIFKDPRQLIGFDCCAEELENYTFLSAEIKKRLTEKKIRYYRQLYVGPTTNTQIPK